MHTIFFLLALLLPSLVYGQTTNSRTQAGDGTPITDTVPGRLDVQTQSGLALDATMTGRFPTAFSSADNIAAQTATFLHGGLMAWDSGGSNWDRLLLTSGALHVNVQNSSLAVTGTFWQATQPVSGTVTANAGTNLNTSALLLDATYTGRMPAGASPADNESNTNTALSRIGAFNYVFDGSAWDRWTGAVTPATSSGTSLFPTPAAVTDATANPTVTGLATYNMCWNGATWDRCGGILNDTDDNSIAFSQFTAFSLGATYLSNGTNWARLLSAANALNSTGTGIATAQIVGQFDDTSPTAITENQFGNLRMSANRNLYGTIRDAAGNERGANVNASNELLVNAGSVTIGTFPDNEPFNLNQIAGSAASTAGTGVLKVGVVGNANAAFDAANNAAAPANVIAEGFETATQTSTQPSAATAGNMRRGVARTDGALYVVPGGPVQWQCNLGAVGTTLTECKAAPGAGLRLYITDIVAISSTTTSGLFTLRFGTGSNCGTGTGNLFFASASATIPNAPNNAVGGPNSGLMNFLTPIAVTANNAVCVLGVVTNTTNIQIGGYTAP